MPATAIAMAWAAPSARTPTSPSLPWAAMASDTPGDLLHPGPEPVPANVFGLARAAYLMVLDHDAPDNASPSSNDNCARALGRWGHHLRRHYGLPDRPDHGPSVAGRQCPGDRSQAAPRSPTSRFPPILSNLFSPADSSSPSPARPRPPLPVHRRHLGLAILLWLQQRPVHAEPEQCAAARHPSGHSHCERRRRHLRARQRACHHHVPGRSIPCNAPTKARFCPSPQAPAARCRRNRAAFSPTRVRWPTPSISWSSQGQVSVCRQPGQQHHRQQPAERHRRVRNLQLAFV
jgi:hypothetical protein